MGLIQVGAGAPNHLDKDDKIAALKAQLGEDLPPMVGIECRLVGGVEQCLAALVEAEEQRLESHTVSCPACRHPRLDAGEWVRPRAQHVCVSCGHEWDRAVGTAANPLATVLPPVRVRECLKKALDMCGSVGLARYVGGRHVGGRPNVIFSDDGIGSGSGAAANTGIQTAVM